MIKKNIKVILAFLLGMVITIPSVYAVNKYLSSDVTYKDTTVENALNELYINKKYNSSINFTISANMSSINVGFRPKYISCIILNNNDGLNVSLNYNPDIDDKNVLRMYNRNISNSETIKPLSTYMTITDDGFEWNIKTDYSYVGNKVYCVVSR